MRRYALIAVAGTVTGAVAQELPAPGPGAEPQPFVSSEAERNALMQILDYAVKNCGLVCAGNVVFFQGKLETMQFPKQK